MMRSLAVVSAFVVLNATGFVVYRAVHVADTPAHSALATDPMTVDTVARPPEPIQPKPEQTVAPAIAPPTITEHVDAAPTSPTIEPSVTEHTKPARVDPPRRVPARPRPVESGQPAAIAKPAPATAKPAVEPKPEPAQDKVLEMESNPYKRGE